MTTHIHIHTSKTTKDSGSSSVAEFNKCVDKIKSAHIQKIRDEFDGNMDSALRGIDVIESYCKAARSAFKSI